MAVTPFRESIYYTGFGEGCQNHAFRIINGFRARKNDRREECFDCTKLAITEENKYNIRVFRRERMAGPEGPVFKEVH
jgi:hypothetical protein